MYDQFEYSSVIRGHHVLKDIYVCVATMEDAPALNINMTIML